jgi:hypothetical protein
MRAVESASYPVVEFLMLNGAKVQQENIQGKTAYDIAKDFADPRVFFAVKNKIDSLPVQKDNKKQKKKVDKKKKKDNNSEVNLFATNLCMTRFFLNSSRFRVSNCGCIFSNIYSLSFFVA